jgi:lipopolysaccharide export system protein LptA
VELRRGDLLLRCPSLEARFDAGPQVKWAHARGGVTLDAPQLHAEAAEATVDLAKRRVELRGGVTLRRAGSVLRADEASLDLDARRVSLTAVSGSIALPPAPGAASAPTAAAAAPPGPPAPTPVASP